MYANRNTKSNAMVAFIMAVVVLFTALFIAVSFSRFNKAPIKAEAAKSNDMGQAAPYTRYPRFVEPGEACVDGDGITYDVVSESKGGNTYGEMWLIFAHGSDDCNAPVRKTARVDVVVPTNTPSTPVEDNAVCYEDQPCWDCSTMGNLICGPIVTPPVVVTVVPPVVVVVPPVVVDPPVEDTCENGNPGNIKCVGNAGEDPNGVGTMPLDNAGGNGNGEHGNQGQGGNGNK